MKKKISCIFVSALSIVILSVFSLFAFASVVIPESPHCTKENLFSSAQTNSYVTSFLTANNVSFSDCGKTVIEPSESDSLGYIHRLFLILTLPNSILNFSVNNLSDMQTIDSNNVPYVINSSTAYYNNLACINITCNKIFAVFAYSPSYNSTSFSWPDNYSWYGGIVQSVNSYYSFISTAIQGTFSVDSDHYCNSKIIYSDINFTYGQYVFSSTNTHVYDSVNAQANLSSDVSVQVTPTPKLNMDIETTIPGKQGEDWTQILQRFNVDCKLNSSANHNFNYSQVTMITSVNPLDDTYSSNTADGRVPVNSFYQKSLVLSYHKDYYFTAKWGHISDNKYNLCYGWNSVYKITDTFSGGTLVFNKGHLKANTTYYLTVVCFKDNDAMFGVDLSKYPVDFCQTISDNANLYVPSVSYIVYCIPFSLKQVPPFEKGSVPADNFDDFQNVKPITIQEQKLEIDDSVPAVVYDNSEWSSQVADFSDNSNVGGSSTSIGSFSDIFGGATHSAVVYVKMFSSCFGILPEPIPTIIVGTFVAMLTCILVFGIVKLIGAIGSAV